jgi:membrane protein required for colicin V production
MATFDYVVIGVVAVSLFWGLWRGVVGELVALAAWGIGVFAGIEYGAAVGQALYAGVNDPTLRILAGGATVFVGILLAMAVIGLAVRSMVKALGLSLSDRLLGGLFGLVRGLLMVLVLVAAGGMTSAPQQTWWKSAMLAAPLETAVMGIKPMLPEDLAKRIRFS